MPKYELGNCLRGYFFGEFETDGQAWNALSKQFNEAFPSRSGREVVLKREIRLGMTEGGNETEQQKKEREILERAIERRNRESG